MENVFNFKYLSRSTLKSGNL